MSEMEQGDALAAYLAAAENELESCPWCETWSARDCLAGQGCPTPDGKNGEVIRALRSGEREG